MPGMLCSQEPTTRHVLFLTFVHKPPPQEKTSFLDRSGRRQISRMTSDTTQIQLIEMVQAYPQLWDKSHELYSDRVAKQRTWQDIAQQLTKNWDQLSTSIQEKRGKDQYSYWVGLVGAVNSLHLLTIVFFLAQ